VSCHVLPRESLWLGLTHTHTHSLSHTHTRSLTIVDAGDIGVSSLEEGHESLASTVEKIIAQGPCSAGCRVHVFV
jgi:arginase family enzyme